MYQEIITFWFEQTNPALWWSKDENFDRLIRQKYAAVHEQARRCELYAWRKSAQGRLAEIIVLDQFSRNLYRDSALSYTNDAMALVLAQEAIELDAHQQLSALQQSILYLPFMHSESIKIQAIAIQLYQNTGIQGSLEFAIKHQKIIAEFGRYPHRNKVLGRQSTPEELLFLQQPEASF